MRIAVIVVLCVFWLFLAFRAYQSGDMAMAAIFVVIGIMLTLYRVGKLRG